MAKNDFRVTYIFKIIIRVCMKNVFVRKILPKRCLLKYVENEISNSTSHKKKERERSKNIIQLQKHF